MIVNIENIDLKFLRKLATDVGWFVFPDKMHRAHLAKTKASVVADMVRKGMDIEDAEQAYQKNG